MANYPEVSGNPADLGAPARNVGAGAPGNYVSASNPNAADPNNSNEDAPKLGNGSASAPYRHPMSEMTPVSNPGTPRTPSQAPDVAGPNS